MRSGTRAHELFGLADLLTPKDVCMMSLLSLADELLQCIFEALHADDVESFTAINRPTYQLACSSILPKHRLRKRNYTRVLLGVLLFPYRE